MKSATEILKITEPGELFSDPDNIRSEYRDLARSYHPDLNSGSKEAQEVMTHINKLYQKGLTMIDSGNWVTPNLIRIRCKDGKVREIHYQVCYPFELGMMYISNRIVAYFVESKHKSLFDNAKKIISNFRYANDKMKQEVSKYLPSIIDSFETNEGKLVMVIGKTADVLLLRDVLKWHKGQLSDRHVAWIQSTLHNLACYIDYAKLSHNAISADTYFISPEHHSGLLLGGWWYCVPQGNKMISVPSATYAVMPPSIKRDKIGSIQTDMELIRALGRELLGDRNGTRLSDIKAAPEPMINWLRGATSDKAVSDYTTWQKVLDDSFGSRKFVEMKLTADMLYTKGGC